MFVLETLVPFFDFAFRTLRNCVFMRAKQRRSRLAISVVLMLPLLAAPYQQTIHPPPGSESLEYEIEWRLVPAGRVKMSMAGMPGSGDANREMKVHLESTGLVSRLFHVNDDYMAEAVENYCTESTNLMTREGSRERETKVFFDRKNHKASYREHDLTKNTIVTAETGTPPCVRDILSGLYHLRTVALEPGKLLEVPVSDGKKSVMLKIRCERREEIKTPLGMRKTLVYEVFAFNNVLYRRPGHLHVWLTDDARRVPVQIEIHLQFTIGTVTLRLDKDDKAVALQ